MDDKDFVFGIIAYVSFGLASWLTIGMLIYSLFSKNWAVWSRWKYIGYFALAGSIPIILTTIIKTIAGTLKG